MDQLKTTQNELRTAIDELDALSEQIRHEARAAATTSASYEEKKNRYLITLFAEEAEGGFKRTETQRQALYRTAFREERLEAMLAKEELQSSRDLFKGLQAKINALQTIARLSEAELKLLN